MTRLISQGQQVDSPMDAVVAWLLGTVFNSIEVVGGLHWSLSSGFPVAACRPFLNALERVRTALNENALNADEPAVAAWLEPTRLAIDQFYDLSERIIQLREARDASSQGPSSKETPSPTGAESDGFPADPAQKQNLTELDTVALAYVDAVSQYFPRFRDWLGPNSPGETGLELLRAEGMLSQLRLILQVGYPEAIRRGMK